MFYFAHFVEAVFSHFEDIKDSPDELLATHELLSGRLDSLTSQVAELLSEIEETTGVSFSSDAPQRILSDPSELSTLPESVSVKATRIRSLVPIFRKWQRADQLIYDRLVELGKVRRRASVDEIIYAEHLYVPVS